MYEQEPDEGGFPWGGAALGAAGMAGLGLTKPGQVGLRAAAAAMGHIPKVGAPVARAMDTTADALQGYGQAAGRGVSQLGQGLRGATDDAGNVIRETYPKLMNKIRPTDQVQKINSIAEMSKGVIDKKSREAYRKVALSLENGEKPDGKILAAFHEARGKLNGAAQKSGTKNNPEKLAQLNALREEFARINALFAPTK